MTPFDAKLIFGGTNGYVWRQTNFGGTNGSIRRHPANSIFTAPMAPFGTHWIFGGTNGFIRRQSEFRWQWWLHLVPNKFLFAPKAPFNANSNLVGTNGSIWCPFNVCGTPFNFWKHQWLHETPIQVLMASMPPFGAHSILLAPIAPWGIKQIFDCTCGSIWHPFKSWWHQRFHLASN